MEKHLGKGAFPNGAQVLFGNERVPVLFKNDKGRKNYVR